MHRSIRGRLEDLLGADLRAGGQAELKEHLASCHECSGELAAMKAQAAMLRNLRAPEEIEPTPGFYARVLQRIEERGDRSVWSVLVDSPFGKRLAYASLTIAILLGSYVVTQESLDGHLHNENIVAQDMHYYAPVVGDRAQQRDAVLENFATQRVDQAGLIQ
ncbi:MAG TPA: hypothetical protein VLI55_20625 [Bryobacteraceae bacterium]|nr:hypothetical protein [Bryobacteraceae bacterium]